MFTKLTRILLTAGITLLGTFAYAQENTILPFSVKLGGQQAKATNEIYATVEKPVAADAELEVEGTPAMLILNIFKSDAKGNVDSSAAPAIILVNNSGKTKLDATMDKAKLAPGTYLANIVQGEKGTARVLFTVQ